PRVLPMTHDRPTMPRPLSFAALPLPLRERAGVRANAPVPCERPGGPGASAACPARPTRGRGTRAFNGFTLMELLVAVSLTLLMMGLISVIFDQARGAIARGTGTSDIIANSKSLSSTL